MTRVFKEMFILGLAGIALLYLILPSFLPDFVPFIGWLDEGVATLILANTLRYYGLDLTSLYGDKTLTKRRQRGTRRSLNEPDEDEL